MFAALLNSNVKVLFIYLFIIIIIIIVSIEKIYSGKDLFFLNFFKMGIGIELPRDLPYKLWNP